MSIEERMRRASKRDPLYMSAFMLYNEAPGGWDTLEAFRDMIDNAGALVKAMEAMLDQKINKTS